MIKEFKIFITLLSIFTLTVTVNSKLVQKFEIKPKDTDVKIGQTVILNCSVSGSHGDVQWTHDGTALGYDRKVPGKPRYSVIWHENENTEFHLKIENVTMDDEGLFSCQAAPIGDWDTKLEHKAKLTVLVGPEKRPEIYHNEEIKNTGEIVHYKSLSKIVSKYTCILRKSKPAGTIKWYLNGTEVASSVGTVSRSSKKHGIQIYILNFKLSEHSYFLF